VAILNLPNKAQVCRDPSQPVQPGSELGTGERLGTGTPFWYACTLSDYDSPRNAVEGILAQVRLRHVNSRRLGVQQHFPGRCSRLKSWWPESVRSAPHQVPFENGNHPV
jgi:hypothetical protein